MSCWSHAVRRIFCCGSGDGDASSTNEPIYQKLPPRHQAHDAASTTPKRLREESVDEIRQMVALITDVQMRMWRLELHLHPLLLYRPEDGEYMDMSNGTRPVTTAQIESPLAPSIWAAWLQERADYGEPW